MAIIKNGSTEGDVFGSFDVFKAALEKFEKKTFYNSVITKSERDNENQLLRYKSLRIQCKFYGKHIKTTYERNTKTYKRNCPFYMTLRQIKREGNVFLEIATIQTAHNHECSSELFSHMPKQRKDVIIEKKDYLTDAVVAKANFRVLHKQLNTTNSKGIVILKDIYNAKAKLLQTNDKNETDLENLVKEMLKIEQATVKVLTNNENDLQSIYFQDA